MTTVISSEGMVLTYGSPILQSSLWCSIASLSQHLVVVLVRHGLFSTTYLSILFVYARQNLNMNLESVGVEGSSELSMPQSKEPSNPSDAQCLVHSEHRIGKEFGE